ncbi:MAG: type II secretion system protein GspH [Beggiatoa sp. IS2]|nr:MAG: type II secretion system protein GspH [Beggiatoa sp. IS2]
MSFSHHADSSGFSLVELLLVLAIVGMLAALVIPRVSGGQVTVLKAQVREAVAVLNYARRSAIIQGQPSMATFYESAGPTAPKTEVGHWVGRGATLQWGGTENAEARKASYEFTFYPEGGSSGGEIVLSHEGYQAKISVNPLTGKVISEILGKIEE